MKEETGGCQLTCINLLDIFTCMRAGFNHDGLVKNRAAAEQGALSQISSTYIRARTSRSHWGPSVRLSKRYIYEILYKEWNTLDKNKV